MRGLDTGKGGIWRRFWVICVPRSLRLSPSGSGLGSPKEGFGGLESIWMTGCGTDRPIDRQTDRQIDRPTDRQMVSCLVCCLVFVVCCVVVVVLLWLLRCLLSVVVLCLLRVVCCGVVCCVLFVGGRRWQTCSRRSASGRRIYTSLAMWSDVNTHR